MAAEGDNNFMRYIYRGEEGERIPREATHITVGEDVTVVRARAFHGHRNIVEIICHDGVKKIEHCAFEGCHNLRRVIMPGVKVIERAAFHCCKALTDAECGELEVIRTGAFDACFSLEVINLPSARDVELYAFVACEALTDVKFGNKLTSFGTRTFAKCPSLERITIPLKDGLITVDDIFQGCYNLKQVDLVERVELNDIIAALHLEDWRNDMNEEIDSLNRILPDAAAGYYCYISADNGEKAQRIRTWIISVIRKINHYQVQHQHVLNEATSTLQLVLPRDIAMNNVLSFLALPSYTEASLEN